MTRTGAEPAGPVRVPRCPVSLSSASVYPESAASAFAVAAELGYDGVEVMVWTDPVSQDIDALERLSHQHQMPVSAVHSPCLLISQRVWSPDPWQRLERSAQAAVRLGASVVVVHPPFRWQRDYARRFADGVARIEEQYGVALGVENMYPWRAGGREIQAYAPDWDAAAGEYAHLTLDVSHAAVAGTDVMAMAAAFGDRLAHLHLADGSGSPRDEHLVPGRGDQPCAQLLGWLAESDWAGHVVLEVNTRRVRSGEERRNDLAQALAFTRLHLAAGASTAYAVGRDGTVQSVVPVRSSRGGGGRPRPSRRPG